MLRKVIKKGTFNILKTRKSYYTPKSSKIKLQDLRKKYNTFYFSTSFIKDLAILQSMDQFQKTVKLLNSLIAKLEANTGGEVNLDETKAEGVKPAEQKQAEQKPAQQKKEDPKKQENKKQEKKAKEHANKQAKPKKQAEKKEPEQDGPKDVDPKFFAQVDIRIGEIVECWKHPESQNLYCQKINIGKEVREIASGLQKFVTHQNMKGKVLVMANLKPRPLAGFNSNGMVVCASNGDHTSVELLIPDGQIGERVYLEGHENLFVGGDLLPVLNPKRKVVQKCLEHFRTDQQGFVIWQGIRLRTKNGFIKAATIKNGNVG